MGKRINGVETPLASPRTFTVKALERSPETTNDRAGVLAFQQQTAELSRAVSGAGAASRELRNRLAHLKVAVETLDAPNQDRRTAIQQIETLLDDTDIALFGDRTVSGRDEAAPFSISDRVGQIRAWGWSHQSPVTGSDRQAYDIASREFAAALGSLRDIELRVETLERDLAAQGVPYTPGSGVPDWPR
jgi:hypothetical protein